MPPITILIVDDHKLLRQSWTMLLDADSRFKALAAVASGEEAVQLARELRPDVVLMDINLTGMDGFEATRLIRRFCPASKVLAVSMHTQPCYVQKMLKMGAMGYITKTSSAEEMLNAIVEVHKRRRYLCEEVRNIFSFENTPSNLQPRINTLSLREMEVIEYLKRGCSSREIGTLIHLSTKTVDVHRYNILKKLNVKNTAALVNLMNG